MGELQRRRLVGLATLRLNERPPPPPTWWRGYSQGPELMTRDAGVSPKGQAVLRCEGVWKLYGDRAGHVAATYGPEITDEIIAENELIAAVREVDLKIVQGEIFVVMGLSGSGKSTLVRCMTGLIQPTLGRLLIDDVELARADRHVLIEIRRHRMGMVFQDFALLPHLTVLGNVAFPLKIQGQKREAREARAREMIELVGLKGRERYYPYELSGGQQQRVGLARSLTTNPEIWFLDEPFSALDPLIRREMQEEFLRLQTVLNKTIVFITHDFDEAVRLADRMAIMQAGRVVQTGTPEQLVLHPATDYVAEFTTDIPRAKVLTVGSVMREVTGGSRGEPVEARKTIQEVAERVLAAEHPLPVADDTGRLVGSLDRKTVSQILLNRNPEPTAQ
jgi:glycine betaine/proline transport system ATP-binding protein